MGNEPLLPPSETDGKSDFPRVESQTFQASPQATPEPAPQPAIPVPSPRAQSWGALISIIVIILMIIIGAFYAWGERISEGNIPEAATISP